MARILEDDRTFRTLFGVNIVVGLAMTLYASRSVFPDQLGYVLLSESLVRGPVFSSWYFLADPPAETLRTWGYPFLLALIRAPTQSLFAVKIAQYLAYLGALCALVGVIRHCSRARAAPSLFLLLAAFNLQIPYQAGRIGPEAFSLFFVSVFVYSLVKVRRGPGGAALLALLGFVNFQIRPVFLLAPLIVVATELACGRGRKARFLVATTVFFILTLIPFGLWNHRHHGVFKVTPLEGGAGLAHLGLWSFKLPAGYEVRHKWGNRIADEVFVNLVARRSEENVARYEAEWREMITQASRHQTPRELARLEVMSRDNPGIFVTFGSSYTRELERSLLANTLRAVWSEPWFYFRTRLLTLSRIWFTGLDRDKLRATDLPTRVGAVLPFGLTFSFIFCGLLYVTARLARHPELRCSLLPLYSLVVYVGVAHVAFPVQARYTVPVHLVLIALIALTGTSTASNASQVARRIKKR